MTLPRPPLDSQNPIPNEPFSGEEGYYLKATSGYVPLGEGLYIHSNGSFSDSPYEFCQLQYTDLPPSAPPYFCNTEVNTEGVTDFTNAWSYCYQLTEFPCVDSSAVTTFGTDSWNSGAWSYCYNLTSFPLLNTSAGVDFSYTWSYCYGLTEFPLLNTSAGENFTYTWGYCYGLTSFPEVDVSNGTNFRGAWNLCTSLTSFPLLNIGQGEDFTYAWYECSGLTSFPLLDVSKGTNFTGAWQNCSSLTSFRQLDTSSGTNFQGAWQNCSSLTSFPLLNTSSGTYFYYAWQNCSSLTTFPAGMFDNCTATSFNNAWYGCALSQQSVDNILVSLDTAGQSGGIVNLDGGTSSAPGAVGLTAKANLITKGWSVYTN